MAFQLASLFVKISAETSGVDRGIDRVHRSVNRLYWQMERLRRSMAKVFVVLGGAVTAVTFKFGEFEHVMAKLRGVSEATADEFEALKARALELGSSTIFGASEVAEAMTNFALAGFNAKEAYAAIPHMLRLSQAGMVDLANGTRIATGVMSAMELGIEDLGMVVNTLVAAAAKSKTNIENLGNSFKGFGAIATDAGVKIDEVSAALALLASRNKVGEAAGNALKRIFSRLTAPPAQVRKALDKLNVSAYDLNGVMKPIGTILDELNAALARFTPQARSANIAAISGQYAFGELSTLLQEGGTRFREFTGELANSEQFVTNLADLMNSTLQSAFKIMINKVEVLAIKLGEKLKPVFAAIITIVNRMVAGFDSLTPAVQQLIGEGLVLAAALSGIAVVATTIGLLFVAMTTPLGIAAAAVALVAGGFVVMGVEGDTLGEKLTNLSDIIGTFISDHKADFIEFFETVIVGYAFLETAIKNFGDTIKFVLLKGSLVVQEFAFDLIHFFTDVMPRAIKYFALVFTENVAYLSNVVLPAYTTYIYENFKAMFVDLLNAAKFALDNLTSNFKNFFKAITEFIAGGFTGTFDFIWDDILKGFKSTMGDMAPIAAREISAVEKTLEAAFKGSLTRPLTEAEKTTARLIAGLKTKLKNAGLDRAAELLTKFDETLAARRINMEAEERKRKERQAPGLEGMAAKGGTLGFIGIDELAKKIQLAAIGGGVPEQQLEQQKKGNDLLKNVRDEIKDVGKKLDKGVGLKLVP